MYPPITLSVAMCTYNGAEYVEEQLNSILNQDMPVNEIVVCDDGSNDETLTIVRRIAKDYPKLAWNIQQNSPNLGVTKNFEKAITLCTGDIIFLSDQDDVWYKDKTRAIVDFFERHPDKRVVFTDATLVDKNGNTVSEKSLLDAVGLLPNINLWNNGADLELFLTKNLATGATMALQRSFIVDSKPLLLERGLHDERLAFSACLNNCLGLINKRLIYYRQHQKNVLGISSENWIFTNSNPPHYHLSAVEPYHINYNMEFVSPHYNFYMKRVQNYDTIIGKVRLCFLVRQYFFTYHSYWKMFFFSDLLYGICMRIREKIVRYYASSEL